MFSMLRADMFALRKSKALLALVIAGLILPAALVLFLNYAVSISEGKPIEGYIFGLSLMGLVPGRISVFDIVYRVFCSGDLIPILIGIFVCISVTNEFSLGTIKNVLSAGFKKSDYHLAKLIAVSAASIAIMLAFIVSAFAAGYFIFGFGAGPNDILALVRTLILGIFLHLAFVSIFLTIAILVRNMGASIAICIGTVLFINIILGLLKALFKSDLIQSWWLNTNIIALINPAPGTDDLIKALLVGLIYLAASSVAGRMLFLKQDVC